MIIHNREIRYAGNYAAFFDGLLSMKAYMRKKHPEIPVELMYNLAGQRGFATIQTRYPSMADYERIDAEMDNDEEYAKLIEAVLRAAGELPRDQFYRLIQDS